MTKMEGGGGKEKGERRPAKEERKPHYTYLSGDHMPLLLPPHKAPAPTAQAFSLFHHPTMEASRSRGLCPVLISPETPGKNVHPLSDTSPAQQAEGGEKGQAPQSSVSWGVGGLLGRGDRGLTPDPVSLPLPLLRMCLPDILCPRFSPEGPERPARTEDASRGESRPFQGQGAEKGLRRGTTFPRH